MVHNALKVKCIENVSRNLEGIREGFPGKRGLSRDLMNRGERFHQLLDVKLKVMEEAENNIRSS